MEKMDFFLKVYDVVKKVPYGRVTTYGAIANYLGSRKSARTVGWAMNSSHTNSDTVSYTHLTLPTIAVV